MHRQKDLIQSLFQVRLNGRKQELLAAQDKTMTQVLPDEMLLSGIPLHGLSIAAVRFLDIGELRKDQFGNQPIRPFLPYA